MASRSLSRPWNLHRRKTLLAKLKEPSTIRGLAIIGGVAGLSMEPAKWDAIGAAVAAVIGLIEIFRKEK